MSENKLTGNVFYFSGRTAESHLNAPMNDSVSAEARIVERVRAGDEQAFTEFYRRFAPMVHGIVLARAPYAEADDLMQEVFLLAYKNLHTLRDDGAVGAWLAMIARNRAREFFRRHKPTEELTEDLSHHDRPQTEAREILTAIRALPESYRETLILRLVEGMTGQEIAEQTGLTPDSVRVNLHRGMKLLRQKLGIKE